MVGDAIEFSKPAFCDSCNNYTLSITLDALAGDEGSIAPTPMRCAAYSKHSEGGRNGIRDSHLTKAACEAVSAACYEGTQIPGFRYTHLLNPVIQ